MSYQTTLQNFRKKVDFLPPKNRISQYASLLILAGFCVAFYDNGFRIVKAAHPIPRPPVIQEMASPQAILDTIEEVAHMGAAVSTAKGKKRHIMSVVLNSRKRLLKLGWTSKEIQDRQNIIKNYIDAYKQKAIFERKERGIPASITIAQGLLESDAGMSRMARENRNHFGIKCFSRNCKKGHCSNFTDDTHKDFFRIEKSVAESYKQHSKLLQKKRYKPLFRLKITDYKGWAKGLQKAGYATDKRYAGKLIKIIEELELHTLDKE